MRQIFLFIFLFLKITLQGQQNPIPIIECDFRDTVGMWADLALIEQKIGRLHDSIRHGLVAVKVEYFSFDSLGNTDTTQLRQGVLVVHETVKEDILHLFAALRHDRFPIAKIIPVNRYGLNRDTTGWDDTQSMEDNNTSAFNYRFITHSTELSPHALGIAIDFNPLFNPYESYHHDGKQVEPAAAFYDQHRAGTISDSVLVGYFDKRGWTWGGRWNNPVDFQHFDKRAGRGRKHYLMKESGLKDYFRYGDGDGSISIYAEPYYKKQGTPEIVIYKEERDTFLHYLRWMGSENGYQLFKAKGKMTWEAFRQEKSTFFYDLWQAAAIRADWAKKHPIHKNFSLEKSSKKPLEGLCVQVLEVSSSQKSTRLDSLNAESADALEKLLKKSGATVIRGSLQPTQGCTFCMPTPTAFSTDLAHLTIAIGIGNEDMYLDKPQADDFQVLYIPAAWKERYMRSAMDRLHFLRALISDDFPNSIALAQHIQRRLQVDLGLAPVSRQLLGPNILERDGIKTDIDGIYGRYIEGLNDLQGAVVYVSPYAVFNREAFELLNRKGKNKQATDSLTTKLAKAIYDGVLEWVHQTK